MKRHRFSASCALLVIGAAYLPLFAQSITGYDMWALRSSSPDPVFSHDRAPVSVRSAGLAGAGTALPGGITSILKNPAFPNAAILAAGSGRFGGGIGYGRDSLFQSGIVPLGAYWTMPELGTISGMYKLTRAGEKNFTNEGALNFSGRLFKNNMNYGAVDAGITARFASMEWKTGGFLPLYSYHNRYDTLGNVTAKDSARIDPPEKGNIREKRLMFDMGFFQKDMAPGIDFGLSFTNLLGYSWRNERPYADVRERIIREDTVLYNGDTFYRVREDSVVWAYADEYDAVSAGWARGVYRTLSAGILWRVPGGTEKLRVSVPVDVELIGLFDPDVKMRYAIHAGLEAKIRDKFYLRAGYARAPSYIYSYALESGKDFNANIFSGGAGFELAPFAVDIYFGNKAWGLEARMDM